MSRISDFNNATALTGSELFVIDQESVTRKATANQLKAFITYTLSAASGASLGGILSGGDISVDPSGVVTVLDNSHNHQWSNITGTPTTLAGFGIVDAANAVHSHPWSSIGSKPTTLAGFGITDAAPLSHVGGTEHIDWTVDQSGSFAIHPSNYSAVLSHNNLTDIGSNSHAVIDSHLGNVGIHIDWTSTSEDLNTSGVVSANKVIADIVKGVSNSIQYIGGDVSQEVGASLRLYGGGFIGKANDFELFSDGSLVMGYDHSADLFDFTDANIATTGSISATNLSGTNTGDQTITLTGGVTGSGTGSFATTVVASTINHNALAGVSAVEHIDWTVDQSATYLINTSNMTQFTPVDPGIVPGSGGGTDNYLRADGTWAVPPASAVTDSFHIWQLSPDDGYTWASTGNIVADNATEIMSLVPGLGMNIEVDGTLNAIRLSSNVSALEGAITHDNLQGVVTAEHIDWTNATDNLVTTGSIAGSNLSGTNTGDQTITLTGDITGSGTGSFAATISNSAVTLGKLQNVDTSTFLGRTTAGSGVVEALTSAQAAELLPVFSVSAKGLVPLSDGNTTKYLRADGVWAATPITATSSLAVFTDTLQGVVPPSGGGTANYLRADGTWAPASGGGGGSVTSVGIVGTDGIQVDSGSPITTSGVITLGLNLGAIDHDGLLNYVANEHIDWTVDQGATNIHPNNYSVSGYTHPSHPGDDFDIDTTPLTGATVISDLDINLVTDTEGHVTDANASVATRTLTLADLGYTGASNANNYSHPNHTGQVTSTGDGATVLDVSAITAQTALTTGLTGTDELLVSDGGIIKRMDVSVMNEYFNANLSFAPTSHTHTVANITDFDAGVSSNSAVVANTAKISNATHTGEVTGATALTLDVTAITNKAELLSGLTATDELLVSDAGVLKRMDISVIQDYMQSNLSLGGGNWTLSGTDIFNSNAGNVGINSPTPHTKLDVRGKISANNATAQNYTVAFTSTDGGKAMQLLSAVGAVNSRFAMTNVDGAVDAKTWALNSKSDGSFSVETLLDSEALDSAVLSLSRAGNAVFGGTVSTVGGDLWVNRTSDDVNSMLFMDADTGNQCSIVQRTGTSNRWLFGKHQTAEAGSNTGSDFRFVRYNDSGTLLGTPILIKRDTGNVELESLVGVGTRMVTADVNGTLGTAPLPPAYSVAKAEGDVAAVSFTNVEADLDWVQEFNTASDVTIVANQNVIDINNAGYYKFTCTLTTVNNNRTELILRSYYDVGLGYTLLDQIHDYVSRDSDQDVGTLTLTAIYVCLAGSKMRFSGEGDCDGASTGRNLGTFLTVERLL